MPIIHAIVLGITQGLSEFLPISSSGHLLLVPWLFGWNDFANNNHLEKTFDVALHLGTFVGAVIYFRSDILTLVRAAFAPNTAPATAEHGTLAADHLNVDQERKLAWFLLIGTIPGAIAGALFETVIEDKLGQIWLIATMLIVFALVLYYVDGLGGRKGVESFTLRDALIVGCAQAVALQPGVSRSGVTISAARGLGYERDSAARLSFLLSLPIIGGAVAKKSLELVSNGFPSGFAWPFIAGIVASAVTGYAAVWGTLRIVRTRSFTPFVIYRIVAGVSVLVLLATSFR